MYCVFIITTAEDNIKEMTKGQEDKNLGLYKLLMWNVVLLIVAIHQKKKK